MRDDAGRGILSSTFSGNPAATEDFFGLACTSVIVSLGEDEHHSPYSLYTTAVSGHSEDSLSDEA